MRRTRSDLQSDLAWLIPVVLAIAATLVTVRRPALVVPLLVIALIPWLLHAVGRRLPVWLFAVLGIVPVAAVVAIDGLSASIFLGTTACCLIASRIDRSWQLAVTVVVGIALPFASYASADPFDPGTIYFAIGDLFGIILGVLLARSRRLDAQLRETDARLVAAVAQEERTRLARDVHDLVAHSLTVVVLQIGGARRVLRADPDRAETALAQAEQVCRESLDGIREVVGLLRAGDDVPSAAVDLQRLVETYRAAGVEVELELDGQTHRLPLLVRGTVYRVLQEALANAARYRAPDAPVSVRTSVDPGGVSLVVANAGQAADASDGGIPGRHSGSGGYGLTGLREQVAAIGGTLTSGPVGDRWLVECRLPQDVSAVRAGPVPQPSGSLS